MQGTLFCKGAWQLFCREWSLKCVGGGWFRCSHAWWHLAVCYLEDEELAEALHVYDNKVVGQLAHTPLVRKGWRLARRLSLV